MLSPVIEPPHDIEAEQTILGTILLRNDAMDQISLLPEHFYDPVHQNLFAGMAWQWQESKCINVMTLRSTLKTFEINDEVSSTDYLDRLQWMADPSNGHRLAGLLREYASRRWLIQVARNVEATAPHASNDIKQIAANILEDVSSILVDAGEKKTSCSIGQAAAEFFDSIENDTSSARIHSGLHSIDAVTGGWRRKQYAIIAGRPSMGKTCIATSAMLRTARKGVGVMYFSLEMARNELVARCLSDFSWSPERNVPYNRASSGQISGMEKALLQTAWAHIETMPLVIDDQRGLTVHEIMARARRQAQTWANEGISLGLVIIDHLGLVKASDRYSGNKVHEVGEISDGLATMAKELNVAVVALHQLNRGTEQRENKRPTLADLRDSGNLEQDADVVCLAYRAAYYLERVKFDDHTQQEIDRLAELDNLRPKLELMIAKNRNGPTSSVELFCDMACNVVRDLAHG